MRVRAWGLAWLANPAFWQGLAGIAGFFAVWALAHRIGWLVVPGPAEVAAGLPRLVSEPTYWLSWLGSGQRVLAGFAIAAVLALALGLAMGVSRKLRLTAFPVLEFLRPIPPLAWLPLSILFWPTSETTMTFLTFMGAFFPILISVLAGIDRVDSRYVEAALSLGSSRRAIFRRILLPGALPFAFTGFAIAIGITWEVVIAAEMASATNGLGYLTWNAYVNHSLPGIIIGMLSIGFAGMASSAIVVWLGRRAMPWQRRM
ncbi:MAG TPA: ABC transporter permease [Pseudomonadota bacterium]|nr:ABC transporter permease [Pseudomonadota bacterium]